MPHDDELGGRLPLRDPKNMTVEQQELADRFMTNLAPWAQSSGFSMTTSGNRLIGPFNAFLLRPDVSHAFQDYWAAAGRSSSLSQRVVEILIVTLGGVWGAEYELYTHKILAARAGLSPAAVDAIAAGESTDELSDQERIAFRVVHGLATHQGVDDDLYRQAEQVFGQKGLYDIAALMGVFHMVSGLLTLFRVPAPDHVE